MGCIEGYKHIHFNLHVVSSVTSGWTFIFCTFGSTSRLCTMSGKFNKEVDLLDLRTARSQATAASLAVSYVPMFIFWLSTVILTWYFKEAVLYTPLYPTVFLDWSGCFGAYSNQQQQVLSSDTDPVYKYTSMLMHSTPAHGCFIVFTANYFNMCSRKKLYHQNHQIKLSTNKFCKNPLIHWARIGHLGVLESLQPVGMGSIKRFFSTPWQNKIEKCRKFKSYFTY